MPTVWHLSRWWDWYVSEGEKEKMEKKFVDHLIC